ncbi:hypothetical protein GCM10010965_19850 [Caldalkalibacillus thermarum]|nr:hypothetical protein GCM10010965_19850 [Caldalkalibacillus thermarum]
MNRKKFNDDFKKMIVDLYHSGTSVKDLSGEYGVSEVTVYRWIKQFTPVGSGDESIPVHTLCKVLGIPRSTYYQRLNHKESNRERENREITQRIISIHQKSKQRCGAPKIHHLLKQEGFQVSLKRVQRLMKKSGIRSIVKKKYKPYPSKEKVIQRDNLLKQDFTTNTINEKWVADITYIHILKDRWCYLASEMDLHTQKIVGYSFAKSLTNLTFLCPGY